MHLTKHHGLGNDFLVLADPDTEPRPDVARARAVCDRHRGMGADGLLHLGPGRDGTDVSMVLLNADGSRAEMSGNGIGCLAQAALLWSMAADPVVTVATDAGHRRVEIAAGEGPGVHVVTVDMGAPTVGPDEPEWAGGDVLRARRVGVGNPHLVLQAAHADLLDDREWVAGLGRRADEATPGGVNVEVVAAADDGSLRMDVHERGVGLTLACGTGAVASAAAARAWDLVGDVVTVRMVGGPTRIDLHDPVAARMTTPITYVGSIELAPGLGP